jgi:hypothetical protein
VKSWEVYGRRYFVFFQHLDGETRENQEIFFLKIVTRRDKNMNQYYEIHCDVSSTLIEALAAGDHDYYFILAILVVSSWID